MTEKEARHLKPGDRVIWRYNPSDAGTVEEVDANGVVVIVWDDCGGGHKNVRVRHDPSDPAFTAPLTRLP